MIMLYLVNLMQRKGNDIKNLEQCKKYIVI